MKKIFLITLLSSVCFSSNVYAINCLDPQNDYEINVCLVEEERKADKELNQTYKNLIKADPRHKKQLINSELAWIKWRDLECKFQSLSYEGGTLEKQEYSRWFIQLTKERTQHLKQALKKTGN